MKMYWSWERKGHGNILDVNEEVPMVILGSSSSSVTFFLCNSTFTCVQFNPF
jgi:hypothetical protein